VGELCRTGGLLQALVLLGRDFVFGNERAMNPMNLFNRVRSEKHPGNGGGKITKVLGAGSPDDVAKNILNGETILQPMEYASFWNALKDKGTCSRYLARIVNFLINFENDQNKINRLIQKKKIESKESYVAVLLITIQFLDMFVGFDPNDEAFKSAMALFRQEKLAISKWNNSIFQGLIFLDRRRGQREAAVKKMVVDCSTLESEEEIRRIGETPSTNLSAEVCYGEVSFDSSYLEFPFAFSVLTNMSRQDVSDTIFAEVLHMLQQAVSSPLPPSPRLASCPQGNTLATMAGMQGRTLALMFMLRELLTISPTNNQVWLHNACEVLIGLYKWPTPYGILAKEVLEFISLEKRSPGDSLLHLFFLTPHRVPSARPNPLREHRAPALCAAALPSAPPWLWRLSRARCRSSQEMQQGLSLPRPLAAPLLCSQDPPALERETKKRDDRLCDDRQAHVDHHCPLEHTRPLCCSHERHSPPHLRARLLAP
jgi:hypothetical protein